MEIILGIAYVNLATGARGIITGVDERNDKIYIMNESFTEYEFRSNFFPVPN